MIVSPGPFITCFLTALVLTAYVFFIIYVKKDILYEGMKFTFAVIVLILIRMLVPLNFPFTVTIPVYRILPFISWVLYYFIGGTEIQLMNILLLIWIVGAVRKLICMFRTNRDYRRYLIPFRVKELSEYPEVQKILAEYDLLFLPVCILPTPVSPELFGVWKPILVLPGEGLTKEELNFACRHELEHYKNHHLWLKFFMDLAACIQWFNPPVRLLQKELVLAFEMSNDRKVLKDCDEKQRIDYVLSIVKVSKMMKNHPAKHTGLSFIDFQDLNAKRRVHFITSQEYGKIKRKWFSVFLRYIIVTVMLVISLVFVPEAYSDRISEADGAVKVQEENSYLVKVEEGYQLYVDGIYLFTCSPIPEEFSDLPIIEEEEAK